MKSIRGTIPAHIIQRVTHLRVLEDALRDCLPAECCTHCRIAGLVGDTLLLVADSSAWRSRLHFYSDRIIKHFNNLGKSPVHRVRIRVAPGTAVRAPSPRRDAPLTLPADAARGFATLARDTDDPDLRQVLRRISQRTSKE